MSKPTEPRGFKSPPEAQDIVAVRDLPPGVFVQEITIRWGDCDPAQIAYTANIPAWGLQAIEAWYEACLGTDWYAINLDNGIGTPFVHLDFDMVSPVTPRAVLSCHVYVRRIGHASLAHRVECFQDGRLCFVGQTVSAFVSAAQMRPIAIPPKMRESIERYAAGQGRPLETAK
jgi:acyl-CoA thioesterase FadM